ncbi:MAG: LysM peptidoglycan-binding domain-containing protein [Candidatus Magasanikbacteria bacterium]|nr:LysM peptidoglycan-binding domain-containing protein [Candidatus Magasanikbacteria bacterium]
MKYKALLNILRFLVYIKRSIWWVGGRLHRTFSFLLTPFWRMARRGHYKTAYFLRRTGFTPRRELLLKRSFLQLILAAIIFCLTIPQTKLLAKPDPFFAGQKTIAYRLLTPPEEFDTQEVVSNENMANTPVPAWRLGALNAGTLTGGSANYIIPDQLSVVAGGRSISKPFLIPGGTVGGASQRTQIVDYQVEPGDSLSTIAYEFGVSVATILWENGLTERTLIRPGDILRVPPTTGIFHKVAKNDTLLKIAKRYGVSADDIINFNHLKENGSDLLVGERLMVPGGVKPNEQAIARAPRTTGSFQRIATLPRSLASASARGFVWPSGVKTITQYFSWRHHAIDVAGPWQTPSYAAKAGVIEKSQCGWNGGYGCYVIIDHGGGLKTLYAHHSVLLVSPGERVEAGQTIALMGNTGNVRGHTGIHLHFEFMINGVRVNPLGYVR